MCRYSRLIISVSFIKIWQVTYFANSQTYIKHYCPTGDNDILSKQWLSLFIILILQKRIRTKMNFVSFDSVLEQTVKILRLESKCQETPWPCSSSVLLKWSLDSAFVSLHLGPYRTFSGCRHGNQILDSNTDRLHVHVISCKHQEGFLLTSRLNNSHWASVCGAPCQIHSCSSSSSSFHRVRLETVQTESVGLPGARGAAGCSARPCLKTQEAPGSDPSLSPCCVLCPPHGNTDKLCSAPEPPVSHPSPSLSLTTPPQGMNPVWQAVCVFILSPLVPPHYCTQNEPF